MICKCFNCFDKGKKKGFVRFEIRSKQTLKQIIYTRGFVIRTYIQYKFEKYTKIVIRFTVVSP